MFGDNKFHRSVTRHDSLHDRRVAGPDVGAVLGAGLGDDGVELHGGAAAVHPVDAVLVVVDGEREVEVAHADVVARAARVHAAVRGAQDLESRRTVMSSTPLDCLFVPLVLHISEDAVSKTQLSDGSVP